MPIASLALMHGSQMTLHAREADQGEQQQWKLLKFELIISMDHQCCFTGTALLFTDGAAVLFTASWSRGAADIIEQQCCSLEQRCCYTQSM